MTFNLQKHLNSRTIACRKVKSRTKILCEPHLKMAVYMKNVYGNRNGCIHRKYIHDTPIGKLSRIPNSLSKIF